MGSQNKPLPPLTNAELLQAQAELWCHKFAYLKSVALHCAIKLGIPNAISRGAASLSELHAVLPVAPSKRPCLSLLMRFLAASGIFRVDDTNPAQGEVIYRLTAVSRLLVYDDDGHASLSPYIGGCLMPSYFMASLRLAEWLETDDCGKTAAEMPFMMAHGTDFWGMLGGDAKLGAGFSEAMQSDSRFVAGIVIDECGEVFAGVRSLVDVGGGDGTLTRAIANAFPHVRCSVLELPQVVHGVPADDDGKVEFVAGDMMEFIPPADALFLKFILHDWSDEDCVTILKRCKRSHFCMRTKRKVIGSAASKQTFEAQLVMDFAMMVLFTGKEREEEQWSRMFTDAGFTRYKISPILGPRSLIEALKVYYNNYGVKLVASYKAGRHRSAPRHLYIIDAATRPS
ncbi:hypothetical protein EJB05_02667, partial [Eragrostis curvula]